MKAEPLVSRHREEGFDLICLNSIFPKYSRDYRLVESLTVSVGVSVTLLQSDVGKDETVLGIAHWCRMSVNRQGCNASKRQPLLGGTSRYVKRDDR